MYICDVANVICILTVCGNQLYDLTILPSDSNQAAAYVSGLFYSNENYSEIRSTESHRSSYAPGTHNSYLEFEIALQSAL